jgi:hypothetical protein
MNASTPDELIAGFPHNSLPQVMGEPTFEDLKIIHRYLNTNAMSAPLYEGGGLNGHLGLIMMNYEYFALQKRYAYTAPKKSRSGIQETDHRCIRGPVPGCTF